VFGRLEFRGVGRQEAKPDAVGDPQSLADMPAGTVEHALEQRNVDAIGQPPLDCAGCRSHEAVEIEPFVLVRADRHGALTAPRPNPPNERLQAEAMLVEGPQLDRAAGRLGLGRVHRGGEVFLKASCASGPAALACRGRGHCRLNPSRCR